MRARELKRWMAEAVKLTPGQREQVLARLQEGAAVDAVATVLRSGEPPAACPKCRCSRIVRNGQANGVQRFKCNDCGASFNRLTGTPLARLRQRAKWLQQVEGLDAGLSVRKAAVRMGVHRTTAFRWRHRFLAVPRDTKCNRLAGVVEADEAYVLRSYKGQRCRLLADGSRGPRRRGGRAAKRGLSDEQVPVLVARNRVGQTTDFVLKSANKQGLMAVLPTAVATDAVLCTDGSAMLASVARDLGLEHYGLNTLRGERKRGAWHIQNVNAYHSRFKAWMARFKGVATSYLPNYLGWFRALDRNAQSGAKAASLLALAISV
ncbi:IS1595 family transposase [Lysobacter fragariae]